MEKLLVLFFLIIFGLPVFAAKDYYIVKDNEYNLEFLCFSKNDCYCSTPNILKIKDKNFVGFGGYHYFDIDTYKYDKNIDTYTVDVVVDRDPSTDLGVCNKCPFDKGNITHLIFTLTYSPLKNIFKGEYKGFISSKDETEYQKGKPIYIHTKFLNIYYINNQNLIPDLQEWLTWFNKDIIKGFNTEESSHYDVEIVYIIKHYLESQ